MLKILIVYSRYDRPKNQSYYILCINIEYSDVLLTLHLSINLVMNQLNAQNLVL